MPKRQVFFSFKYKDDFDRVNQIRNMGIIEGDSIVSDNEWEKIKQTEEKIKKWIHEQMEKRSCVIVCIGEHTHESYYCQYEIEHAWKNNKGIFGLYIHNLNNLNQKKSTRGRNPFDNFYITKDGKDIPLSKVLKTYDPIVTQNKGNDNISSYNDIKENLESLIENAIKLREEYGKDLKITQNIETKNTSQTIEIIDPPKQWI